jgi:hypothetical protein
MASRAFLKLIDIFSWCLAYDLKGYKGILGHSEQMSEHLTLAMFLRSVSFFDGFGGDSFDILDF